MCQREVQYEHLKVANGAGQFDQKEMQLVFRTVRAISMTACLDRQKPPRVLARGSKAFALPQSRPQARTIAFERVVELCDGWKRGSRRWNRSETRREDKDATATWQRDCVS